jgi:hypothetical protein
MVDRHQALARAEIIEALTAYTGVTTADGATPGFNTLIDSLLILRNDFISGKTILIGAGVDTSYEDKGAQSFDNLTGTITVAAGFSAQIKQGTPFRVLNVSPGGLVSALLNAIQAKVSKLMPWIDLWSAYDAQVVVDSVAGDEALPSITIAGLPAGVTVARAIMMLKYRTIENINAAVNSVNGAQNIQAQKAVGGAWITGIALGGGECSVPATTRESGDVMMGTADVSAQVPVNGAVMSFKWTNADAAQDSLNFNDVQIGLRIWFTV